MTTSKKSENKTHLPVAFMVNYHSIHWEAEKSKIQIQKDLQQHSQKYTRSLPTYNL